MLGCTGMGKEAIDLEQKLGIPVINPAQSEIMLLISIIMSNKNISKKNFIPYD